MQDVKKLHKQIQRCYAENRRAFHPVQVCLKKLNADSIAMYSAYEKGSCGPSGECCSRKKICKLLLFNKKITSVVID